MPFTEDFNFPSAEELKVQEIDISAHYLKAGAIHFGKYCDEQCKVCSIAVYSWKFVGFATFKSGYLVRNNLIEKHTSTAVHILRNSHWATKSRCRLHIQKNTLHEMTIHITKCRNVYGRQKRFHCAMRILTGRHKCRPVPMLKYALIYGKENEFMLCRRELNDPRKCVNEGKDVTACGLEFFQKVKQTCRSEFEQYADCLEWNSPAMKVQYCRKTQAAMDDCMAEKLKIERPYMGYFTEIRTHKTNRPKPGPPIPRKVYEDDRPSLPDDYPREESKFGAAYLYFN